jgi:hypothetical protein
MDDAFAGGVCRCKHCGTIQTVPSARGAVVPKPAKPLYQSRSRNETSGPTGSGLEQLGEVISSSGLQSGRLHRSPSRVADHSATGVALDGDHGRIIMWVGAAVLGLLIGVGAWLVVNVTYGTTPADPAEPGVINPAPAGVTTSAPPAPTTVAPGRDTAPPAPATTGPAFLGVPLTEEPVIFLLDRSKSSAETFGTVALALYKTLESLPPNTRFQVILWDDAIGQQPDVIFPKNGPDRPTQDSIAGLRRVLDGITPFGQSMLDRSLKRAMSANPGALVIVTAKGWNLDEDFVQTVQAAHGGSRTRIHTIAIGNDSDELQTIAERTGGQYRRVTRGDLSQYVD